MPDEALWPAMPVLAIDPQVERHGAEVHAVHCRGDAGNLGEGRVVADLHFVQRAAAEVPLQVEDEVGRVVLHVHHAAVDPFRARLRAAVMEDAAVGGPAVAQARVEAKADRVLLDRLGGLELVDVEIGVGRCATEEPGVRRGERRSQDGHRGNCPRPGRCARRSLDEVQASIEPIAFVAAEEERAVLHQRSAQRAAELMLRQRRFAARILDAAVRIPQVVEVVLRVEAVVAEELEGRSAELVRARLGDDADLTAGAGAELGGVVARLDAELLHVLEACLQLEGRCDLAADVARRGVDDGRTLDAIELDDVLLVRLPREAHVVPGAGARILRAWRLQHELRHLAAVHRQVLHFALAHVRADARRADVQHRCRRDDGHVLSHAGRAELEAERQFLSNRQVQLGVLHCREAVQFSRNGVGRRPQAGDRERAGAVGDRHAVLAGAHVRDRDGGARDESVARISNGADHTPVLGGGD